MLLKCKLPGLTGHPPHLKEQGAAIRYLKRQRALSAAERKKPGQEVQRKSLVTGVRIFFSEDATTWNFWMELFLDVLSTCPSKEDGAGLSGGR